MQVGRELFDREHGRLVVIGELALRMIEELRRRRVAGGHADEVAIDGPIAVGTFALAGDARDPHAGDVTLVRPGHALPHRMPRDHVHAVAADRLNALTDREVRAQIDHRRHLDAGLDEVEGNAVAIAVGGDHNRAAARPHPIEANQPLRRRAEHDARHIVVAEHHGLLERAGRHHHLPGPELIEAVAPDAGEPVIGEPGLADRARENLDVGLRRDRGGQLVAQRSRAVAVGSEAGVVERAAEDGAFLDQDDLGAGPSGLERGRHAGRPAPDHRHVRPAIGLVVIAGRGVQIDPAQPRPAADNRLPVAPGALGLVKGLVVEAHGEERAEPPDPGVAVALQAARVVLAPDLEAGPNFAAVGQHVGLFLELHQGVGILAGHGEHAAGPVIFERARQQPLPVGGQRAGDGVAGKALVAPAFEGEGYLARAVEETAGGRRQSPAVRRHGLPPLASAPLASSGAVNTTRLENSSLAG